MKKISQEEFELRIRKLGFTTTSKYANNITPVIVKHIDGCGEELSIRPMELFKLKDGKCPKCNKFRHFKTLNDLQKILPEGYSVLKNIKRKNISV